MMVRDCGLLYCATLYSSVCFSENVCLRTIMKNIPTLWLPMIYL